MKAVILFSSTALATGLHNFYWLMSVVNGAPIPLLNCIALLGSVALLAAAVLILLRPRLAAKIGLAGSLLLWVFYAPVIVIGFLMPSSVLRDIQADALFHDYVPLVGMLIGPLLLIVCTAHSTLLFRRSSGSA